MVDSYHLSGIEVSSRLYTELDSLHSGLQMEWEAFTSDPHPNFSLGKHVSAQNVTELVRCHRALGKHIKLSRLPLDSVLYLTLMMILGTDAAEEEAEVMVSMANECLLCLRKRVIGGISSYYSSSSSCGSGTEDSSLALDIEEIGTVLNIGEQEKCLQTLLECFKYILEPALRKQGGVSMTLVENYFSALTQLQRSIGNVRKVFTKYIANDVLNCCLKSMTKSGNEALNREYVLPSMRETIFGNSSIDEMFRVANQIVNSGEALIADGGSNPYRKFYVCIHSFCHNDTNEATQDSVKSFGVLFEEMLKACLRKCKAVADKNTAFDKKSIQAVVKVCSAFLLQVGGADTQASFRNEILHHVSDASGTLLMYDSSGDLLELFAKLWQEAKARLLRTLEASCSDNLGIEVNCLRHILAVHHRLVLEEEGELDWVCAVILAGDADAGDEHSAALGSAQVELLVLVLDLYHRLGRMSEVLLSLCKVSRIDTVASPRTGPRRVVLGSEQVQRLVSISFAELSVLQAADLWKSFAEESKCIVGLNARMKVSSTVALSLVCQAILSVVISRPSSKRVQANRVTVPVAPTFTLIETCLDLMSGSKQNKREEGSAEICADSETLAAGLLRVASLLICQVSSREMEAQRTQWQSYISLVLDKWVKADPSHATDSVNTSLFSAIVFTYIAQEQCGLVDDLPETATLVRNFVDGYNKSLQAMTSKGEGNEERRPKGRSKKRKVDQEAVGAACGIGSAPPGFDALLVQYADILGRIFASEDYVPLYQAMLTECRYLFSPSGPGVSGRVRESLPLDSPVLVRTLQLCLTSSLETLAKDRDATYSTEEATRACRALDFYRSLVDPDTEGTPPLTHAAVKLLEDILVQLAGTNQDIPKFDYSSRYHVAGLVSELLLIEIKKSTSMGEPLVSSMSSSNTSAAGGEPLILGFMRIVAAAIQTDTKPNRHLSDLCRLLMSAVVEQTGSESSAIDTICHEVFREKDLNGPLGRFYGDMAATLCTCLKSLNSSMALERKMTLVSTAEKALAGCAVQNLSSDSSLVDFHSVTELWSWFLSCKAVLIRIYVSLGRDATSGIEDAASGLLRRLVNSIAAYDSLITNNRSAPADLWLTVLADLLEAHRLEGLVIQQASDAVFMFRSMIRWLDRICTVGIDNVRLTECRLALVRALTELLTVSGQHSASLTAAIVDATGGLIEVSSDSADSARALFSASLAHRGSISFATISAAREILLDAASKVIHNSSGGGVGPSFADILPEEAAFFQCILPEVSASKKRKIGNWASAGGGGEGEAGMLSMKAIDTYAVLAAQSHSLLDQPGGAKMALELCKSCLTVFQEICVSQTGQLSFCFPLFSNAIARIAHCLLLIGPEVPGQKQALGTVRRVMLSVASAKGLTRFFALFVAAMVEVLVACGSNGRHGAEPLVSGMLTLADRCSGLGRRSTVMPLLGPEAKELFTGLVEKYGAAFKYKG